MQSGITASTELLTAFHRLGSDPSQRGLLVSIQNESLVPLSTLPASSSSAPASSSSSSFYTDLAHLPPLLNRTTPLYILLRHHGSASASDAPPPDAPPPDAPPPDDDDDGFIAITYIPDAAPVRQKTLFAATRHTLVRALGPDRFRATRFVTEPAELHPDAWRRHERGEAADGPLTEEEKLLQGVRAEEEAGKHPTQRRQLVGGRVAVGISEEARRALEAWGRGEGGGLVQLVR